MIHYRIISEVIHLSKKVILLSAIFLFRLFNQENGRQENAGG